jgi:hypothetical protein
MTRQELFTVAETVLAFGCCQCLQFGRPKWLEACGHIVSWNRIELFDVGASLKIERYDGAKSGEACAENQTRRV